jgi:beta-N-acetylhexosaminidase
MTDSSRTLTLGVTRLLESERDILKNARVGLIANSASVDQDGIPTSTLLADAGIQITSLFCPEHGYRASAEAGEDVPDGFDKVAGLPVRSLYGESRKPTEEMLQDIDALVFDLQDVGVRCYTYIWTMALAMQSAALFGKTFVVLDRPNPLGGVVIQGPVLDPEFASFLGMYPIPLRHGMTTGELALMFNKHFAIGANLAVVRMKGWRRRLRFPETGLKWIAPSPAMRSAETALPYAGMCLFEGTNISEGRGTSHPFRLVGAPWLDPNILAEIDSRWLDGFALAPQRFTPENSKHAGTECVGLLTSTMDNEKADPIALAVALIAAMAARHKDKLEWNEKHFDRIAGTNGLRAEILAAASENRRKSSERLEKLFESWDGQHREFDRRRSPYLLYEG